MANITDGAERKQLIAEVWRYLPFYQPGEPKIADDEVPVPVELLERVIKALADTNVVVTVAN